MPLTLVEKNKAYVIEKICGNEKQKHYIEAMGIVEKSEIMVLSKYSHYYIVLVKDTKIGVDQEIARRIIVIAN